MSNINPDALRKIGYGLYVLTAHDGGKDNGCVVNVVAQVTDTPLQMLVTVNKKNLTHDMIDRTGLFNVSMLTESTPMEMIKHFGFQSGHNTNKFEGWANDTRSQNGLIYLPQHSNSYISGRVVNKVDLGTHTLFIAEVTEAVKLNDTPSLTYNYYQQHIKPQGTAATSTVTRWVCQVCGYVYEGENIPDDFVCPWCKHGKTDFVKAT